MSDRKNPFSGFKIEIDPKKVEEATATIRARLSELRERAEEGFEEGRYTKVRLSHQGRQVGPDLPLGAFLAGEGLAFLGLGPLWALVGNLGARVLLEVTFVHEADELVDKGNEAYLHGELEIAETCYRDALARRPEDPSALFHLGVLCQVQGRLDEAKQCFRRAAAGPEGHEHVVKAAEVLARLGGRRTL